jgi:hypothetical protein
MFLMSEVPMYPAQACRCAARLGRILYEKRSKLKRSGNGVYYTACSFLVMFEILCSELHYQQGCNSILFPCTIAHIPLIDLFDEPSPLLITTQRAIKGSLIRFQTRTPWDVRGINHMFPLISYRKVTGVTMLAINPEP